MSWTDWKAFQSSHLNAGRYDPDEQILQIQFVNGAMYAYFGVKQTVVDTLQQSSSPSDYFAYKIKTSYPYQKLMDAQTRKGTKGRPARGYR
jgi:hypothetical protein